MKKLKALKQELLADPETMAAYYAMEESMCNADIIERHIAALERRLEP